MDVWIYYRKGQRIRQDEDNNFNGKIDARYIFKDGQVTDQRRLAEEKPDHPAGRFLSVKEELDRSMTRSDGLGVAQATWTRSGETEQ